MEIYQPAFANMTIKVYILRMPLAKIKKQVNIVGTQVPIRL